MSATYVNAANGSGNVPAPYWIQSPQYDLAFFILSPLLGLLAVLPNKPNVLALVLGTMLGLPHYLSTFTFYCWDENRPYHRARWMAFFLGPAVIIVMFTALLLFRVPSIIQVTIYCWNIFHVARQSCGLLSVYRHRAGVVDPRYKAITNTAMLASNGCLAFWNIAWYPTMHHFLTRIAAPLPLVLWAGLSVVALWALLRLGLSLRQRWRTGNAPRLPELCLLIASLLLFHPYLWVRDAELATLGMLVGHFAQYLGLVWLLHRRKFVQATGSPAQRWLARLSQHGGLLLSVACGIGIVFFLLQFLSQYSSLTQNALAASALLLVLLHFYLDGLFWALKEPHIRQSIVPYLMRTTPGTTTLRGMGTPGTLA